jgi:hypothetical protein
MSPFIFLLLASYLLLILSNLCTSLSKVSVSCVTARLQKGYTKAGVGSVKVYFWQCCMVVKKGFLYVYNLIFSCRIESKISEANSQEIISCYAIFILIAISDVEI